MDKITHEIRLNNWKSIIEQCNSRPRGITVKQWLKDNNINDKTYYYWQRRVRQEAFALMKTEHDVVTSAYTGDAPVSFAEVTVPVSCSPSSLSLVPASPGSPAAVIRNGNIMIELSVDIPDRILVRLLEVVCHA